MSKSSRLYVVCLRPNCAYAPTCSQKRRFGKELQEKVSERGEAEKGEGVMQR